MEITLSLPMLLFLMLMTGFAGFVDSAAGGGGLISLPAYLFAGLPVHYTYGTNKFSAACGTTFATAQFFQKGAMNIRVGLLAAVGSFVGSALGSHIVLLLSDQVLRTMMLIILPVAAVLILWRRDLPDENRDDGTLNAKKAVLALAIGLGIGLYDGIVGPGTGTFAIIAFTTLMGFDLRTANGNGKVLNLASNYASLFTYLMNGLMTQLVRIEPGNNVEEAHMRNRQLIARWVYEKGAADKVVELVKKDGKTYVVINDYEKVRELFGELLAEIQRIKSTGDYDAARELVESYAVKVDPELHAEVLERYKKLNLAPYKGFVNPKYEAVTDADGNITDVKVTYDEGYAEQMLRYSKDYSVLPSVND